MSTNKQPHPAYNLKEFASFKNPYDRTITIKPSAVVFAFLLICALCFKIDYSIIAFPFYCFGVYFIWGIVKDCTLSKFEEHIVLIKDKDRIQAFQQQYFVFCLFMVFFPISFSFCLFNSPLTNGGEQNLIIGLIVSLIAAVLSITTIRLAFKSILLQVLEQKKEEEELKKYL